MFGPDNCRICGYPLAGGQCDNEAAHASIPAEAERLFRVHAKNELSAITAELLGVAREIHQVSDPMPYSQAVAKQSEWCDAVKDPRWDFWIEPVDL